MRTKRKNHSRISKPPEQDLGVCSVQAQSLATDGSAIARGDDGIVVFVKQMLPTEKAIVKITTQKATYKKAALLKLEQRSDQRVQPACVYYDQCGGCQIQHIQPERQMQYKLQWFIETLRRIGKWEENDWRQAEKTCSAVTLKSDHYRRRIRLHFNGKALGFRKQESHHIVPIKHCLITAQGLNDQLSSIAEKLAKIFATLAGKVSECEIEVTQGDDEKIIYHLAHMQCQSDKAKKEFEDFFIKEFKIQKDQMLALQHPDLGKFKIRPQSFVQPHEHSIASYCQHIKSCFSDHLSQWCTDKKFDKTKSMLCWDLYAGSGFFTSLAYLAGKDLGLNIQSIGIEGICEAIESLKKKHKGLPVDGLCQDVTKFIDAQFDSYCDPAQKQNMQRPSLVILDPPRSGAGIQNMQKLVELCEQRALVLYLACDGASFARDTSILLEGGFKLKNLFLFDAFAQTVHYEVLGCFERI